MSTESDLKAIAGRRPCQHFRQNCLCYACDRYTYLQTGRVEGERAATERIVAELRDAYDEAGTASDLASGVERILHREGEAR